MLNKLKIAKSILFILLAFILLFSFIFWRYPEYYISYKTGYSAELIRNFRDVSHDKYIFPEGAYDKACENFNSKTVAIAYGEMGKILLTLIKISFIAIILFAFFVRINKNDSLQSSNRFVNLYLFVLFIAFIIYFWAYSAEIELDFLKACKGIIMNGGLFE